MSVENQTSINLEEKKIDEEDEEKEENIAIA